MKCKKCCSQNVILYYEKPDGEYIVNYYRCNDCIECWEEKVKKYE